MPKHTALPSQSRLPIPPTGHRRAVWALAGLVLAAHLAMLETASLWMLSAPAGATVPAAASADSRPAVWVRQTVAEQPAATAPLVAVAPVPVARPVPAPDTAQSIRPSAQVRSSDAARPAQEHAGSPSRPDVEPASAAPEPPREFASALPPHIADTSGARTDRIAASRPNAIAQATRAEPEYEALTAGRNDGAGATPPRASPGIDSTLQAPPSAQLTYSLQRGLLRGNGVLDWYNEGPRYRMSLEGELPLIGTIFSQQSEGGFDVAGLAPLRHTERRLRRSERAVNFVRPDDGSAARITFSASTASLPLHAGAQDRLSWMAQLATRLAGVRKLAAGASLEMDVASTGGDVQHWVFVLQGVEADGSWHWRRDSDHPTDTRAEVWTDPAQAHWPRRVRLSETHSEPLELTLLSLRRPPP